MCFSYTPDVRVAPALSRIGDFAAFLTGGSDNEPLWSEVLKAEVIGRPVGAKEWIAELERRHGKVFSPQKRGPKPKEGSNEPRDGPSLF